MGDFGEGDLGEGEGDKVESVNVTSRIDRQAGRQAILWYDGERDGI